PGRRSAGSPAGPREDSPRRGRTSGWPRKRCEPCPFVETPDANAVQPCGWCMEGGVLGSERFARGVGGHADRDRQWADPIDFWSLRISRLQGRERCPLIVCSGRDCLEVPLLFARRIRQSTNWTKNKAKISSLQWSAR